MFKHFYFFLIIISFLFIADGFSQQKAGDVLKALQEKFDSIGDIQVKINHSVDGKPGFSGLLFYKKENKLRLETKNSLIISNGETSWNFNMKENKVIISGVDEESAGIFSINELVYGYPSKCDLSLSEDEGFKILTLVPNDPSLSFNYLKLYIDEKNLISKVLLSEGAGSMSLVNISEYVLNKNIPDSKFNFTPPEGCKVIDLR